MTKHKKISKRLTTILAVIFFIPPLALFISYSSISLKYGSVSRVDRIDALLDPFPSWMHNYSAWVTTALVMSIIAIIMASKSYKKRLLSTRVSMLMIVLISIFLVLFYISQLL